MDSERDILNAWRFVRGFRVPSLGDEERVEWLSIITHLSVDQWQRGCRKTLCRPEELARFRPSPMEFRAYARGEDPPRIPPFPSKDDGPLTANDVAAKDEWLAKCREYLKRNTVLTAPQKEDG